MDRQSSLEGRTALVTGAGRGIGAAVARSLAAEGAHVVLSARSAEELELVATSIGEHGGTADVHAGDLSDLTFVDELFGRVEDLGKGLEILVNNAGVAPFGPIEDVSPQDLEDVLRINTVVPYACMRRAMALMGRGSDDGHIVNIGSVESYWTAQGESGAYPASKFALRALTMAATKELKARGSGIRVSMVNPGGVDTALVNPTAEPRPDLLRPEDVARAVMHTVTAPPGVHVFDTIVVAQSRAYW
jgi:NAD(P)-dependent dehydrogenase (short-subunit alcohol dehydrogenase family)